jgi:SAM-dependent methyltransferase
MTEESESHSTSCSGDAPHPSHVSRQDEALGGWYNRVTGELVPHFPVGPEDVVVDVGCGDGAMASFCAERGAHIVLADIDAAKIEVASKQLSASGAGTFAAIVTDAYPLPLQDRCVTRVICTEVLEHVDDPAPVVAELERVGKPQALYLITAPAVASETVQKRLAPPQYFEKPNHIRIFDDHALGALIEGAGLKIEHRFSHGFFWALWWSFFWEADVPFERPYHPLLVAWSKTWSEVLKIRNGARIKQTLDACLPKSQFIIARKPG